MGYKRCWKEQLCYDRHCWNLIMTAEPRWRQLLHRNIVLRLAKPVAIGLVMLGLVILDVLHGNVGVSSLPVIIPGMPLGYPFGRMTKVDWKNGKLNTVRDRSQWIILAVYFAVRFGTRTAVSDVFGDLRSAGDIVLPITSGMFIRRSIGTLWPVY